MYQHFFYICKMKRVIIQFNVLNDIILIKEHEKIIILT